jgi:hypothetical protein
MPKNLPHWKPHKRIKNPKKFHFEVIRRDGKCKICLIRYATDAHHLISRGRGGDDVRENGLGLCHRCHMNYHDGHIKLKKKHLHPENIKYLEEKGEIWKYEKDSQMPWRL